MEPQRSGRGFAPRCKVQRRTRGGTFGVLQDHVGSGRVLGSVSEVGPQDWDRLFGSVAERWAMRRALEAAAPEGFRMSAVGVFRDGVMIAAAPLFSVDYRLDTSVTGALKTVLGFVYRLAPAIVRLPVLGIGAPLSDHSGIGFHPDLTAGARSQAFEAMTQAVAVHGRRTGAHLLVVKDLSGREASSFDPSLSGERFTAVPSLPLAVLDLPFPTVDDYVASLSASVRSDLRRKQRLGAGKVRFERARSVAGIEAELVSLYDSTRTNGRVDFDGFDRIAPNYIGEVLAAAGDRAHLLLGWVGEELASFSLNLVDDDRVIAHKIGMRYPLARQHNMYFLNWLALVDVCIGHGIRRLEMGQTTYALKQRLGCRLEPSTTYFRHWLGPVNSLMNRLAPRAAFDDLEVRSASPAG
jgi:hypothetical protein